MLERVYGQILTGPLAELRFAHAQRLRRRNIIVSGTLPSAGSAGKVLVLDTAC